MTPIALFKKFSSGKFITVGKFTKRDLDAKNIGYIVCM